MLRTKYALLWVLITAVLVGGLCIWVTGVQQRDNNRKWCAILTSLDQPDVPATTERGQVVQQQIHKLRADLGCGGG